MRRVLPCIMFVALAATHALSSQAASLPEKSGPSYHAERMALIQEMKAFEAQNGFAPTNNFLEYDPDVQNYPQCYSAPKSYLPYSYMDPAIAGSAGAGTEQECDAFSMGRDWYFYASEAVAGIGGTPITPAMVESPLDRFMYLVFHEDCHEQILGLARGINEAACDIIAMEMMIKFAEEKFGIGSRENNLAKNYLTCYQEKSRIVNEASERLFLLYEDYARKKVTKKDLLLKRAAIFREIDEKFTEVRRNDPTEYYRQIIFNNASLGFLLTYTRNQTLIEKVFDRLGHNLPQIVSFLRQVTKLQPGDEAIVEQYKLQDNFGVKFIRAEEAEMIKIINALAEKKP
mgnify:FL=1